MNIICSGNTSTKNTLNTLITCLVIVRCIFVLYLGLRYWLFGCAQFLPSQKYWYSLSRGGELLISPIFPDAAELTHSYQRWNTRSSRPCLPAPSNSPTWVSPPYDCDYISFASIFLVFSLSALFSLFHNQNLLTFPKNLYSLDYISFQNRQIDFLLLGTQQRGA